MSDAEPSRSGPTRLERVLEDFLGRHDAQDQLARQRLLESHPDLADGLRGYFSTLDGARDSSESPPATVALAPGDPQASVSGGKDRTVAWGKDAGRVLSGAGRLTDANRRFGDYELLEVIARGGMGVVYKARQVRLNRLVAVKMILAGQFATDADVERFYSEAQAAANLRHPHIIAIHEVGECDGQHFFSMDYIEGENLSAMVKDHPVACLAAAGIVRTIADAIHHAHQQGILHRDLKPSNVLIGQDDEPRVTDFGLARRIEGGSELTATGTVIGTPSYMPPEQAAARHGAMGPASDVYSLGAILYELITARPPFKAATTLDTLMEVLHSEPVVPRLLNRAVDRDLETICLKCLQKDPRRRYTTALELADDLRRYTNQEPILARPVGRAERLWRWCRRSPVVATLTAAVFALLIATALGGLLVARRERGLRSLADTANTAAQSNARESRRRLVRQLVGSGIERMDQGDLLGSLPWLVEALRLQEADGRRDRVHRLRLASVLEQSARPTQVWFHEDRVRYATFDPGGGRVATASGKTVRIWNAQTGAAVGRPLEHDGTVTKAVFSPDGRWLATAADDGTATLWNSADGRPAMPPLHHTAAVNDVAFSPDGRLLATACADKTAQIFQASDGQPVAPPLEHVFPVNQAVFSADGRLLATASALHQRGYLGAGEARIWNAATGEALTPPLPHDGAVRTAAFNPDSTRLVTTTDDFAAVVWDTATGRQAIPPLRHINIVTHALFSPDGLRLVTACDDNSARVWNAETGEILTAPLEHLGEVKKLGFSPNGRWVATAAYDGAAQVWDAVTGREVSARLEHAGPVDHVEFSSDGHRIVTASRDGTARVWDLAAGETVPARFTHQSRVRWAAFSPDGRLLATAGEDNKAQVWDAASAKAVSPPLAHEAIVGYVGFSPDSRWVVTASEDKTAQLRDARSGKAIAGPMRHGGAVVHAAFSHDGKRLVTCCADGQARLWDAASGKPLGKPMRHAALVAHARFSPDGRLVVTASDDATARIWNAHSGEPASPPLKHAASVMHAEFSPDGRLVVSAGGVGLGDGGGEAKIWDSATGKLVAGPLAHSHGVPYATFDSTSRRVATASYDDTARIWQATSGAPLTPPMKHGANVNTVAFSPDDKLLLTASSDKTARVWDAASGEAVTPPLAQPFWCQRAVFSPDALSVLAINMDASARLWRLPAETRAPAELALLAELLTGRRLYEDQGLVRLDPRAFRSAWEGRRADYAADFHCTAGQVQAWHERQAHQYRVGGNWFAAAWHLDQLMASQPDRLDLYAPSSFCQAELGNWQRAAADFEHQVEGRPVDFSTIERRAMFSLASGDMQTYRQRCSEAVDLLATTSDGRTANSVLWLCTVAPDAVEDYRPLIEASDALQAGSPNHPALLFTAAATSYRAGDMQKAVEQLNASVAAAGAQPSPLDWLLLAMAEHRLGRDSDAKQHFELARQWIERETNPRTQGTFGSRLRWDERLQLKVLLGEAMLVLATRHGDTPSTQPDEGTSP